MKFNFFKTAMTLSLGLSLSLVSCDKNEIENGDDGLQSNFQEEKLDYDAIVEELSNDTNVVSFSFINPEEMLRSQSCGMSEDPIAQYVNGAELRKGFLYDIKGYVTDSKATTKCYYSYGYRYYRFDVDLNMGAGGKYIYLDVAFTADDSEAITNLYGYNASNVSSKGSNEDFVRKTNGGILNCNEGTKKGGPIYLTYTKYSKVKGTPMHGLLIVAYKSKANDKRGSWHKTASGIDLNQGAGGRYIYLFTL